MNEAQAHSYNFRSYVFPHCSAQCGTTIEELTKFSLL